MPEGMLRTMYGTNGGIMNPIEQILRQADTLKLTAPQADSVATMNRWYTIRLDSIWSPVARTLGDAARRVRRRTRRTTATSPRAARRSTCSRKLAPDIKGLLTAEQRRKLPTFIASYLDPRYLASIRSGTAGMGMGGAPMMMGGGGGGGMMVTGGGGGGNVIIR